MGHHFIFKNTGDFSIKLDFTTGESLILKPNELLSTYSETDSLHPVLERFYRSGDLDYWLIDVPDREKDFTVWKQDGF